MIYQCVIMPRYKREPKIQIQELTLNFGINFETKLEWWFECIKTKIKFQISINQCYAINKEHADY